jgi:hypothetical protein
VVEHHNLKLKVSGGIPINTTMVKSITHEMRGMKLENACSREAVYRGPT